MLLRLTRARSRAAGAVVLLYLLCVLAPAAAFAMGDASRVVNCLTDDNDGLRSAHVHHGHQHEAGKAHPREEGAGHDHAKIPDGKSSDRQCCGLICLSALPASIVQIESPALATKAVVSANQGDVAGKTPDRLYRPPIASPAL